MNIRQLIIFWSCLLLIAITCFVLRVIDFAFEAQAHDFHMTRFGVNISGVNAFILQLLIIFGAAIGAWVSSQKLMMLRWMKKK